jgi:alpha-L-fucosidase
VEERRLPSGDSELRLVDEQGNTGPVVTLDLSTQHRPDKRSDDPRMAVWRSWKYGAFFHYNSSQFSGSEHCTSRNPLDYAPSALDVRQWVQTVKQAGMKYAVLTTAHTPGFLLWDSPTTKFDVGNSSDTTDVVKAFVEECRRHDIIPALYYCVWGGPNHPGNRRAEQRYDSARAVILYQLHELATRYGEIPYFWIDMMHAWAPADLSAQDIYNLLRNINPDAVVIMNQGIQDGTQLLVFPTDAINGELILPPPAGHLNERTVGGTIYDIPFEFALCSQALAGQPKFLPAGAPNNRWFTYGEGKGFEATVPIAPAYLYAQITEARRRGASNVLISCAPDHTGRFRDKDVAQLTRLGGMLKDVSAPLTRGKPATASSVWQNQAQWKGDNALDGDSYTRWVAGEGVTSAWLEVDLEKAETFNRTILLEAYPERDNIRRFQIEYEQDGEWKVCHSGTRIGQGLEVIFPSVTARRVRLHIIEATESPTIFEFQLFPTKEKEKS